MKTDDLINALVADAATRKPRLGRVFAGALVAGTVVSALIFFLWIHPRADFLQAATTARFMFKFIVTSLLAISAFGLTMRLARPGAPQGLWGAAWLAAPALLLLAVIAELYVSPPTLWAPRLIGVNARFCLALIPLLSIAPLAGALLALREGAPTRPRLAGAFAGLLAGAIAATLYAAHCTDDSPLFVAAWYSIAIAIVTLAGALIGSRFLRW
ncbi:NrsF family protein [Methylocystis parvus]|uniref:DUF1109 family protein n=1 Tax=Methylocystis parvus TaxID=134 RepID=A0A6B8M503_9HYPH|nr:NrsF family protein [Methylocystis parvus]QGM97456.1 DUF1109 family protein [Methylocystis parvus]WBJ98623.1 NrsF family protein [Methylocystis parvus OBBP]